MTVVMSKVEEELFGKLHLLARLHNVDFYEALNRCPVRGKSVLLEDLVAYIVGDQETKP